MFFSACWPHLQLIAVSQENLKTAPETGTLNNFENGARDGYATSVYRIGDDLVLGSSVFASWSTVPSKSPSALAYDDGDAPAVVEGAVCSGGATPHAVFLSGGEDHQEVEEWGTATECDAGPALLNSTQERPPVILLSGGNDLYMVVEEDSSYPSFLYSVWRAFFLSGDGKNASDPAEMHHVFYVSSTTRLAEAIVSGVVNGITTGGGCVDLLSQYSEANTAYNLLPGVSRAAPFGEVPDFSSVESMDQVEEIVAGFNIGDVGVVAGLVVIVVTGASFVGCLCSIKSREGMDVFDRDAVIKAVALPNGGQEVDITSPTLKIYVRQSDDARLSVVVSDDTARRRQINRCVSVARRVASALGRSLPTEVGDGDDDDEPPVAREIPRTWSLPRVSFTGESDGREALDLRSRDESLVRTRPARSPTFVELIPSPVPSPNSREPDPRRLPTFFSGLEAGSKVKDSRTDPAPISRSRSMKVRGGPVLQSARHGNGAPPTDAALPTTGRVDIPEPGWVSLARYFPGTTSSVKNTARVHPRMMAGRQGKSSVGGADDEGSGDEIFKDTREGLTVGDSGVDEGAPRRRWL